MHPLITIILYSWIAGIMSFLGGVLAVFETAKFKKKEQQFVHSMVAFGGGILISAVAFSLAPEAIKELSPFTMIATFYVGGTTFYLLDYFITKHGGNKAQFMAMVMDFIPEAIAMGAVFGYNKNLGILLALFIGAQNLPEGFNAFREARFAKQKTKHILHVFFWISFLGPICAASGYFLLNHHNHITAGIMSFAAGGILYLIFQDIAPESTLEGNRKPALGAVSGFLIGMLGKQLLIG